MSYTKFVYQTNAFQIRAWEEIKNIINRRGAELLPWIVSRFLSHKSRISVKRKTGRLASSGQVVNAYRRGTRIFGGVKFTAIDPVTGFNYAKAHFRLRGESANVVIVPKYKQALTIPITEAGTTYGGTTFARMGLLFVRNSFDPYDIAPVAVLKQRVTYPKRIDVEAYIYPYIMPKIQADIARFCSKYRPS